MKNKTVISQKQQKLANLHLSYMSTHKNYFGETNLNQQTTFNLILAMKGTSSGVKNVSREFSFNTKQYILQ